jgi:hypothetical protein
MEFEKPRYGCNASEENDEKINYDWRKSPTFDQGDGSSQREENHEFTNHPDGKPSFNLACSPNPLTKIRRSPIP